MNEYDSHLVESLLIAAGYEKSPDEKSADLIILNTCSVRQKAEERALGRIRSISSRQSPREIAVIGCMAQRMGEELLKINPHVKYVLGTGSFHRVVDLIANSNGNPVVDISCRDKPFNVEAQPPENKISSYVTIMRGCDNYCSYCIVPYVRGRERYRPPDRILTEITRFENSGCREIWLLGQNVNSYRFDQMAFPELLELVCEKTEIPRLRFLTSHPKDFSERLIEIMADYPEICKGIHLPLQSGSDRVLKRMNRKYTSGQYLEKVQKLKEKIPEVVITTDIIVGFPGETEADYLATRELMEKIEYNSAFMFRYSVRSGTKAEQFEDDIPEKEKLERLDDLIKFQKRIAEGKMTSLIGSDQSVLLEQTAKQNDHDALGKTDGGLNVVVRDASMRLGEIVRVRINSSSYTTLVGEIITQ
jgi:tRNA-2-methylthio-N6-dimethylallyladenosine synthase